MKKNILGLVLVLFVSGCVGLSPKGLTLTIPGATVAQYIQDQFPISKDSDYGKVMITDPDLLLSNDSDKINIGSALSIKPKFLPAMNADVNVSGKLTYNASSKEFYLLDPNINSLSFNEQSFLSMLPDNFKNSIKPIIKEIFRNIPIYKLDPNSIHAAFVNDARIENGNLEITYGLQ